MDIASVATIIEKIANGLEPAVVDMLHEKKDVVVMAVQDQLWSGLDGEGNYLNPNYDNDPYFNEPGFWEGRAADYKKWKQLITPPSPGSLLNLPPRPDNVPNLYIDGTFYGEIIPADIAEGVTLGPGGGDAPEIVSKWGDKILRLGDEAVMYFNRTYTLPAIRKLFAKSGYQ